MGARGAPERGDHSTRGLRARGGPASWLARSICATALSAGLVSCASLSEVAQAPMMPGRAATAGEDSPEPVLREAPLFGGVAAIELEPAEADEGSGERSPADAALGAIDEALHELRRTERRLSSARRDSEVAAINRAPEGQTIPLSRELREDLEAAIRCARETDYAFHYGLGAVRAAYRSHPNPSEPLIEEAAAASRARNFRLEPEGAVRLHRGFLLEESGFGAGIALDRAMAGIERRRIPALLRWGDLHLLSRAREAELLVAHPGLADETVAAIRVQGGAVALAGTHRAIDPRTAHPAPALGSLAVWAPTAMEAQCLAGAFSVMGPDEAFAWVADHPEVELLIVPPDLQARASCGLRSRLQARRADLRVSFECGDASQP